MNRRIRILLIVGFLSLVSCRNDGPRAGEAGHPFHEQDLTGAKLPLPATQQLVAPTNLAPPPSVLVGQNDSQSPTAFPQGPQLAYVSGVPFDVGDLNGNETVDAVFGNEFGNESLISIHYDGSAVPAVQFRPFPGHQITLDVGPIAGTD